MPSLTDFMPQGQVQMPAAFTQADIANRGGLAQVGTGYQLSRLQQRFGQRTMPQLASALGARGTFFSGGAQIAAKEATEDVQDQGFDLQYKLATTLADLARSGVLAQIGVQV